MRKLLKIGIVCCCAGAWAQEQPVPQNTTAPKTQAQALGVYAYPKNNQDQAQQIKDESECYGSAKSQTGIDPAAPPPPTATGAAEERWRGESAPQKEPRAAPRLAPSPMIPPIPGSCRAAAGAVRGRRQQKKANNQAQQQSDANAQAQQAQSLDTFKRAFSACLDARNYSVK